MNASNPPQAGPRPFQDRTVAEFATVGILSCTPDAPLDEVAWLMSNNRVHAVLVVDDEAAEPPVISDIDLVAAAASGHYDGLCARDIAGTEGLSVTEDETLARAAQLVSEHRVGHLIVRDSARMPIGIVSSLDLARAIAQPS